MFKILTLLLLCSSVHAETADELKTRMEKEMTLCDGKWSTDARSACQLMIANKISLMYLIEQVRENEK